VVGLTCEVCRKAPASRDDILCLECSRMYTILLDLLSAHPELAAEDLERLKELFDWRMQKSRVVVPDTSG
jgi:hypothetical protein